MPIGEFLFFLIKIKKIYINLKYKIQNYNIKELVRLLMLLLLRLQLVKTIKSENKNIHLSFLIPFEVTIEMTSCLM